MLFWKKKNNAPSVGFLFVQAITLADKTYEEFIKTDEHFDKENSYHWYFYFSVAASMTGLFELKGKEYENHYFAMEESFKKWNSHGIETAKDFNQFVRDRFQIDENGKDNLSDLIGIWLFYNTKGTTDVLAEESGVYMSAGNYIYQIFYRWFSKNSMPIN